MNLFFALVDQTFTDVRRNREFILADNDIGRHVHYKVNKIFERVKKIVRGEKFDPEEEKRLEAIKKKTAFDVMSSKINQVIGKVHFVI